MKKIEARHSDMDRRSFLRHAGRYVMLSAMAALGVFGVYKRRKVPAEDCIQVGYCSTCTELSSCSLPDAVRERSLK